MDDNHEQIDIEIAHRSAAIYLPIAIGLALMFLLASSLGGYPWVARIGGTVWVGLLSLIVGMPLVTSRVKRNLKNLESSQR